jgi:HD-GYP domain-containing protein (c-di-GMP phosphodiesterase class II)
VQGLAEAAASLHGGAGVDVVVEALLRDTRRLLRCPAGAVHLVSGDKLVLAVVHNDVISPSSLAQRRGERTAFDAPAVCANVARSGAPLVTADVSTLHDAAWDDTFEQRHGFRTRALLALPVTSSGGRVLAVVELQHAEVGAFTPELEELGRALVVQAGLALEHALDVDRLRAEQVEVLFTLACIPEYRDADSRWHVRRISGYSRVVARAMGLDAAEARAVELASALHDVGKVGIPPEILFKPGKLSDEEFRITREHCALGHELLVGLGDAPALKLAAEVALAHHERWDGGGYPNGLAGAAIPLAARIVAVADVFDALTTRRSYKPALGVEQSMRILGQESGKHFDPDLVDAFGRVFSEILDVKRRFTPDE